MYNLCDLLQYQATIRPHAIFLMIDDYSLTYQDIYHRVEKLTAQFQVHGPSKGERVAIALEHVEDYIVALFACWKQNACVVPIETSMSAQHIQQLLDIAEIHWILSTSSTQPDEIEVERIRSYNDELWCPNHEVPAELLFTSGSSGIPKAVMISHTTLLGAAIESCDSIHLQAQDIQLTTVPFWHAYGQNRGLLSTVYAGAAVALKCKDNFAAKLLALKEINPTVLISMPSFYGLLGSSKLVLPSRLRIALSGAAPLAPAIRKRFEQEFNVPLLTTYGLTECQVIACQRVDTQREIGAVGHAVRGVHLRLVNEAGHEVSAGETGRVLVKGHNVMLGYFGNVHKEAIMDGWFDTQDIGRIDEKGALHLVGRSSAFIKRAGVKVFPLEIQNFLMTHQEVVDAIASKITIMGNEELIVQVVVAEGSLLCSEQLLKYCADHLPSYKVPLKCELVAEIKKLPSGKPLM